MMERFAPKPKEIVEQEEKNPKVYDQPDTEQKHYSEKFHHAERSRHNDNGQHDKHWKKVEKKERYS